MLDDSETRKPLAYQGSKYMYYSMFRYRKEILFYSLDHMNTTRAIEHPVYMALYKCCIFIIIIASMYTITGRLTPLHVVGLWKGYIG